MLQRVRIGSHERGLLHHGRDYLRYLTPGVHWIWGFGRSVQRLDTSADPRIELHRQDVYLADEACREDLAVADLADDERALVWVDGRIHDVIGPGRTAYWKTLHTVRIDVLDATRVRLEHPLLGRILDVDCGDHLLDVHVPLGHRGLIHVDGRLAHELGPGRYGFWNDTARVRCELIDVREQALDVQGQEILSADKVSLRVNLLATFTVVEPRRASEATADLRGAIYRELQLALREAVGSRKLDELLSAKEVVADELRAAVAPRAELLGARLGSVGIKDVILPGDMKLLLNQVIEAEKRAQANLIVRREETAATRSLLNTARLIESSPTLLRLKELEAAERIAKSVDSIEIAGGGLDALVQRLIS